jgi:choline kinase
VQTVDQERVVGTAVVLAAGRGTRIASVTNAPKPLLEVAGKSLIRHHVDTLEALGFREIVVVVGYEKEQVHRHLAGYPLQARLVFVENEDVERFGNGVSLRLGLERANGSCLVIDGDLLYESEVLERFLDGGPDDCVLVGEGDIDDVECAKTVTDGDGNVTALVDKRALLPHEAEGFLGEAIGVLMFTEAGRVAILRGSERFFSDAANAPLNWEHLLNACLAELRLASRFIAGGRWIEIDTPEDYAEAKRIFDGAGPIASDQPGADLPATHVTRRRS